MYKLFINLIGTRISGTTIEGIVGRSSEKIIGTKITVLLNKTAAEAIRHFLLEEEFFLYSDEESYEVKFVYREYKYNVELFRILVQYTNEKWEENEEGHTRKLLGRQLQQLEQAEVLDLIERIEKLKKEQLI